MEPSETYTSNLDVLQKENDQLKKEIRELRATYNLADAFKPSETTFDISHAKTIEEALCESEERFSVTFRRNPDALSLSWLHSGTIIDINDAYTAMLGWSKDEVIGKNAGLLDMIDNPAERERGLAIIAREGRLANWEMTLKKKNGEKIAVLVFVEVLQLSRGKVILTTIRDITATRKMENALRESEEHYRQLVESANSIILRWKANTEITFANTYALNYFGYTREELIGKSAMILVPDSDLAGRLLSNLAKDIVQNPGDYTRFENENVLKNGERRWISWTNRAITDSNGEVDEVLAIGNDVTRLKKAEEEAQAKATEIQAILGCIRSGVIVYDSQSAIVGTNASADKILEYPADDKKLSMAERVEKHFVISTEDGRRLSSEEMPPYRAVIKGEFVSNEVLLLDGHGKKTWIICNAAPLVVAGKQTGGVMSILDISSLKQAEQESRQNEERFRLLADNISQMVWIASKEGKVIWVNKRFKDYTGLSADEVRNGGTIKVHHPDFFDRVSKLFTQAIQNETPWEDTFPLLGKDGNYRWFLSRALPIRDNNGEVTLWFGTNTDIHEQKLAEEKAYSVNMELEAILNCTPEGIMVFDTSGKIKRSNIAAERFYKLTDIVRNKTNAERVAGDYEAWYDDLRKLKVEELPGYRVAIKGESISNQVLKVRIHNETMWVMFNGAPLRISGELAGGVLSTVDITALKQAEHALQKQNDELKKAKEKAEESDRFKTAFIANISHEIRTPMSGIMGFAELLQNPEISNESQASYIEAIVASGKRMLNIVNDLINISKIEVGQFEMKRETTDIGNLLDELFVFFLPEANRKNIELRVSNQLPADSILIDTDRTKLSQVISNLVKNALKFTSQGFVGFGCLIKNQSYLFYVEDTGAGISKEFQQQIFERFKQGEIPEAGIPEGMGLGLAISKAYIGILGGSLWVDSIPGKGSTFYFTIPLSQKVASTAASSVANIRNNIKETFAHAEVLIADDEDFIYFFLNEALKANNIKSFHAKNGQEAVDIVRNNPNIQLVLMDSRMPVMGGLEATRQIKQLHPGIPVILLSALAHDSDIKAAFDAGCNDYIVKPFTLVNLKSKLSMYLNIKN